MLARMFVVIFVFCVTSVLGQTTSDINLKYGDPTYAYSVSQYIWMTPDYAADGQVCRMRLYPKHIDPKTDYLSPQLNFEELSSVLNKMVPLDVRGEKEESFGLTDVGGGSARTRYRYERVTFVFTFAFRIEPGATPKTESISFPVAEILARLPKKSPPSIEDFAPSQSTKTEMVTILWNNRNCAG